MTRTRRVAVAASALALAGLTCGAIVAPASAAPATAPFLAPYYTALDVTGDLQVTEADLAAVAAALGATSDSPEWAAVSAADVDADGTITVSDLAAVSQRMVYDDGAFEIVEASVVDMQAAMNAGVTTSVEITTEYLERIAAYDTTVRQDGGRALNSIIATNPEAIAAATAADAERADSGMTSMLLGVPVAVKDNYNTVDMPTTAGYAGWAANQTSTDAAMVEGLREDGAVIIAKASLDEFAYGFASEFTTGKTGGASTLVASPYLSTFTAGGSSGGTGAAIAANLAGVGFGSDTGGSIRVPSSYNQLVGIRPTVGLASRDGIVPLALSQDTGGPMTRSVTDAAVALDAVVGVDPADSITAEQSGKVPESYTSSLDETSLEGARIGYVASMVPTGNAVALRLWNEALQTLTEQGATVVNLSEQPRFASAYQTGFAGVLNEGSGSTNEFKHDLEIYSQQHLAPEVPFRSLQQIVDSRQVVANRQSIYAGRNDVTSDTYEAWAGPNGSHTRQLAAGSVLTHQLMNEFDLDAIAYPSGTPYGTHSTNMRLSPNTGMPAVTVPMGQAEGAEARAGAGVNLELLGRDYAEGTLIGIAYDFEQATHHRTSPGSYGPLS